VGHSDEEDSEAEEDQPIVTNDKNTVDFLDIVAGVNFKVENHRKRLRYIENLDTATAHTPIVIAVKKAEIEIEGLKHSMTANTPQTTIIKEIAAQPPQPTNTPPRTDDTQPPANTTLSQAKADLRALIQTRFQHIASRGIKPPVEKQKTERETRQIPAEENMEDNGEAVESAEDILQR
jgi:hypothetical protein